MTEVYTKAFSSALFAKSKIILISLITISIFLTGCGAGNDGWQDPSTTTSTNNTISTLKTGYLIDSAVQGVDYSCGTDSNTTSSDGKFIYDTSKCSTSGIEFKIGDLVLGTVLPSAINSDGNLTIQELAGKERMDITDGNVSNMAVLLQSLDSDNNASNGIYINPTIKNILPLSGNIKDMNSTTLSTAIQTLGKVEVPVNTAIIHLLETTQSFDSSILLDIVPNDFTIVSKSNQELNTIIISDEIVISGLTYSTYITVSNGNYSVNDGAFVSTRGLVKNGDKIKIQHTTASTKSVENNTTVIIGGVERFFTSTTASVGYLIDSPIQGVDYTCGTDSNTTNSDGKFIYDASKCSTSGIEFKIGNLVLGTVLPSAINNDGNLTIQELAGKERINITDGGVVNIAVFLQSLDVDNNASNGIYINTTIKNTLKTITSLSGNIKDMSNETLSTAIQTLGKVEVPVNTAIIHLLETTQSIDSTIVLDIVPNDFTFVSKSNQELNTTVTSDEITIGGLNTLTYITISDGSYSINGGVFVSTRSLVKNGDKIKVQHTSAVSESNPIITTTVTIGGIVRTFTSTVGASVPDKSPDSFTFTPVTDKELNTEATSNTIKIIGINTPTNVSISGGEYQINGGNWTDLNSTISNDQNITVRHTTANEINTRKITIVTIGGVDGNFTSTTTSVASTLKKAYLVGSPSIQNIDYRCGNSIYGVTNMNGEFTYDSNISKCSSLEFKIGTLLLGSITPSDINTTDGYLTIQELVGKTRANITDENVTKLAVLLQSLDDDDNIVNGIYITDSVKGAITFDQNVSSMTDANITTQILQATKAIGTIYEVNIHTALANLLAETKKIDSSVTTDIEPNSFTFTDSENQILGSQVTSNAKTITGINVPTYVTISNGEYRINDGSWTTLKSLISNDQNITVRHITLSQTNSTTTTTVTIGGVDGNLTTTRIAPVLSKSLLRTGQTNSYDINGALNSTIKDDGYYSSSVGVARSFSRTNDVVTDIASGLQWQDDSNASSSSLRISLTNANNTCNNLILSGKTDWRLPTVEELMSISNKGEVRTATFSTFLNVASDIYWTSTIDVSDGNKYWGVNFNTGIDGIYSETELYNVRCVRNAN